MLPPPGSDNRDHWRLALLLCLLLLGTQQLGAAALIKAKAWLAPLLIARAWEQSLAQAGEPVKPWSWADTWPVARLLVPGQGVELLVLAGDSGQALAFGPGHSTASAALGSPGLAVIGGHRDTHFAFLRRLRPGAALQLELPDGQRRAYRVVAAQVVDSRRQPTPLGLEVEVEPQMQREMLLLVTCYPFDAWRAGGPLRYVVSARPLADQTGRGEAAGGHS